MSPLDNQDPLAQLNDIISPSAPHWFPPAPIYWVIMLLSLTAIVSIYYFVKKAKIQKEQQKIQLAKLVQLQQDKADFIALNQLLKGCVLSYFSRDEVASLHGEQWFDFIQKYACTPIFENKQRFMQRLYQAEPQQINETDFSDVKKWITELPKQIKKYNKKQGIKDV